MNTNSAEKKAKPDIEQNMKFGRNRVQSFPLLPLNNSDSYNSKFGISQLNANN